MSTAQATRPSGAPGEAGLELEVHEHAAGQVLALRGRLGVAGAADARLALAAAVPAGGGDLVVDLGEVVGVDATGLGVLVGAHRAAGRAGRRLVLRDVPPQVGRLLVLTRLSRVLHVTASSRCA